MVREDKCLHTAEQHSAFKTKKGCHFPSGSFNLQLICTADRSVRVEFSSLLVNQVEDVRPAGNTCAHKPAQSCEAANVPRMRT